MDLRTSHTILILILISLLFGGLEGRAYARSSGVMEGSALFGMGEYRAEVDGEEVQTVSSTYQQYSFEYSRQGLIGDARMGNYTLLLGYEFNVIDPTVTNFGIKDTGYERLTAKKPFYDATVVLAPGGLPFRLKAYVRDKHHSNFSNISAATQPDTVLYGDNSSLNNQKILGGVDNGTRRELGLTLLLGIRNGSYLGAYRDVLSQLPRLLIDYKQIEVKDLTPDGNTAHYRHRDLAFVSLNKLENWIHLRMSDYHDYLAPDNDVYRSQVLIGTIDQLLARKWINMTNWLQVSADFSFTNEVERALTAPVQSYQLNLISVAKRKNMAGNIYSNFSRVEQDGSIALNAYLPVSAIVDFDRDTRLRSRFVYGAAKDLLLENSVNSFANAGAAGEYSYYIDTQLELYRTRRILLIPRFELESTRRSNSRENLSLRVGSDVLSNNSKGTAINWLGGYVLTVINSNNSNLDEKETYVEHELHGRINKRINSNWSFGGDSLFLLSSGEGNQATGYIAPKLTGNLSLGGGDGSGSITDGNDGISSSAIINLNLEHRYQQLGNRLDFGYNIVSIGSESNSQISLAHQLDYTKQSHEFTWQSTIDFGANSGVPSVVSSNSPGTNIDMGGGKVSSTWSSDATYNYNPNRSIGLTLDGNINGVKRDKNYILYSVSEELDYRIFTMNGIIRKIAEFSQGAGFIKVGDVADWRGDNIFGHFSASYFPVGYLYGSLRTNFVHYIDSGVLEQINTAEVGVDFKKLKLAASYSEGKRGRESEDNREVMERLWELKAKKIF